MASHTIGSRSCSILLTAALLASSTGLAPSASAQGNANNKFGSLFNPAHTPEGITTLEEIGVGLAQVARVSGHISYMHDWAAGDEGMAYLAFLMPLFRQLGLKVFLQLAPTVLGQPQTPDGLPRSFADPQVRERYLSDVARIAAFKPEYLNLCAEVDFTALLVPGELPAFASLYREAFTLAKQISPTTKVGVSYQLDLFFGSQEFWLPEYLGPRDYVAFTTYPSWVVHNGYVPTVQDFPAAVYEQVRLVFPTEPVIFSEVGWPSAGGGTLDEQAAFIRELPRLMANVRPELVTWTTLSDTHYFQLSLLTDWQREVLESLVDPQSLFDQLNNMGLVDWEGVPKPALEAAEELVFEAP